MSNTATSLNDPFLGYIVLKRSFRGGGGDGIAKLLHKY